MKAAATGLMLLVCFPVENKHFKITSVFLFLFTLVLVNCFTPPRHTSEMLFLLAKKPNKLLVSTFLRPSPLDRIFVLDESSMLSPMDELASDVVSDADRDRVRSFSSLWRSCILLKKEVWRFN